MAWWASELNLPQVAFANNGNNGNGATVVDLQLWSSVGARLGTPSPGFHHTLRGLNLSEAKWLEVENAKLKKLLDAAALTTASPARAALSQNGLLKNLDPFNP